jgi:hypothetical protein
MSSGSTQDWPIVKEHLDECLKFYTKRGIPENYVVVHVLRPLRDRYNQGERTRELAEDILAVKL